MTASDSIILNLPIHHPVKNFSQNRGLYLPWNLKRSYWAQKQRSVHIHATRWRNPQSPWSWDDHWQVHLHHIHRRFCRTYQPWNYSNLHLHNNPGTNFQEHPYYGENRRVFLLYHDVDKALRNQLVSATPITFLQELQDYILGISQVKFFQMLKHLRETYGKTTQVNINHNENTSAASTVNIMFQGCVGKVYGFKSSDMVLTSIYCGSAHDVVLNPTLNFFFYHHSLCL